jgi:hypothetical protein
VEKEWSIMYNNSQYSMYDILAFSESNIFAVGVYSDENNNRNAGILHYDGATWTPMLLSNLTLSDICLKGVWGLSPNDIFAIGNSATVIHYDGISWSNSNYFDEDLYNVTGIWGSSANNIYITSGYRIMHFDGVNWEPVYTDSSRTSRFTNIWGTSDNDIYAISEIGFLYHFDGSNWISMNSHSIEDLYSISGTSHYDIFVSGNNGTILHYNGYEWSNMFSGTDLAITGIYSTSPTDVYAVTSNSILYYDGNKWAVMRTPNNENQRIQSISASPSGMVYAVCNGVIICYGNIFTFANLSIVKNDSLESVSDGTITNNAAIPGNEYIPNSINNSVIENTAINSSPSPEELIIALKFKINKFISEGNNGIALGNSLLVKLDAAMTQINKNNKKAAKNQLNAFINQVKVFIINRNINRKNGNLLIDAIIKINDTL